LDNYRAQEVDYLFMNKDILEALELISEKLKNKKIKWVISGSTSLLLQGILAKANDIDIMTDKEGAFRISKIFKDYELKPVKFSRTKIIKSYWGKLKIGDKEVDIMGEFSEKIGNKWVNISRQRLESHKIKKIGNIEVPVTTLESHLSSYKVLGRKKDIEKIKKIEEFMKRKNQKC
jgi:predicted nucleotidyltransferase